MGVSAVPVPGKHSMNSIPELCESGVGAAVGASRGGAELYGLLLQKARPPKIRCFGYLTCLSLRFLIYKGEILASFYLFGLLWGLNEKLNIPDT